ncbi:PIN domain containing protein [Halanaeroarchaeum sp. HSR-CO]|uniref:PIN domain-containing protein n=1 Tax=Halanaeroarchaeum sp. HSR-CO TaxID=2866382 RepID=UPI00217ED903|nr:PIN domain-containing protein [Halanaeroarchaeum sp. HSR-CO]UWG48144.1 PIN domain containing protein [Halanaeroarchaeum sp. HSR-CO]
MILETSFVEDVARNDPAAVAKADTLREEGIPERLSTMTLYELYWGVGYVEKPRREIDRLDAVLGTKAIYDVTPAIARKAGRIAGSLTADGRALQDPGDEIIGATGVVHDEPVLTKNVDHFERIPGLTVETY